MILLSSETGEAEVDRKGAYLRAFSLNGKEIIKRPTDDRPTHGGSAVLIPYAGRVRNAEYTYRGRKYVLPANDGRNSIHGLLKDELWEAMKSGNEEAVLSCDLSISGYPSTIHTEVKYRIRRNQFSISAEVRNKGDYACPLLVGFHPYFITGGQWRLSHSEKLSELIFEDGYFPNGNYRDVNLNGLKNMGEMEFDNCFRGGGVVTLHGSGRSVTIRRKNMPFLVIYNGKYAEGISVAIEPMTGAPDAFNNGIGLIDLEPGKRFSCGFSIELTA